METERRIDVSRGVDHPLRRAREALKEHDIPFEELGDDAIEDPPVRVFTVDKMNAERALQLLSDANIRARLNPSR